MHCLLRWPFWPAGGLFAVLGVRMHKVRRQGGGGGGTDGDARARACVRLITRSKAPRKQQQVFKRPLTSARAPRCPLIRGRKLRLLLRLNKASCQTHTRKHARANADAIGSLFLYKHHLCNQSQQQRQAIKQDPRLPRTPTAVHVSACTGLVAAIRQRLAVRTQDAVDFSEAAC